MLQFTSELPSPSQILISPLGHIYIINRDRVRCIFELGIRLIKCSIRPIGYLEMRRIDICSDIRYPDKYLARYPVSRQIFGQISGIRTNIWPDIRYPDKYLFRYPVSGQIFLQISGIRTNIWSDIRIRTNICSDIRYTDK